MKVLSWVHQLYRIRILQEVEKKIFIVAKKLNNDEKTDFRQKFCF